MPSAGATGRTGHPGLSAEPAECSAVDFGDFSLQTGKINQVTGEDCLRRAMSVRLETPRSALGRVGPDVRCEGPGGRRAGDSASGPTAASRSSVAQRSRSRITATQHQDDR
jgi:hypothetical protein